MNKQGPIIIIEDDEDDQLIFSQILQELDYKNEVEFFRDGVSALKYLEDESVYPFLIISDVNLPKLNGFELRKMVHTNEGLSEKCIPYLFFSTAVDQRAVHEAYTMSVQGFFLKASSYHGVKETIRKIVEYWQECYSPLRFPRS